MAVIEPQKEPKNILVPLIASVVLLLVLSGIGYAIYLFIGGPTHREIKLTGQAAKDLAAATDPNATARPGPPLPPTVPLEQATDPGPTLITLDMKNATLSDVLAAISKQAGVKVGGPEGGGGFGNILSAKFDFAVTNEPFWSAIGTLCKARGMYPVPYRYNDNGPAVTLIRGASPNAGCPIVKIGSSTLLLTGVTSQFNADVMGARPASKQLSVAMILYVDPKLDPFRVAPTLFVEQAVDENGVSLVRPRDPWQDQNNNGQHSKYIYSVQALLQFAPNAGQRIAHLKGYASVVVADTMQSITIKNPLQANNVDNKIGSQTIRFLNLRKTSETLYQAQFQADSASPAFKDWNNVPQFAKLRDAAGNEYQGNTHINSIGGKTVGLTTQFNSSKDRGEPAELDLTLPGKFKEIRVPFEFTDLPLPH